MARCGLLSLATQALLLGYFLLLSVKCAGGVLSGSFCNNGLAGMQLPAPPALAIYSYKLDSVCMSFPTSQNFTVSFQGTVTQGGLPRVYAVTATCSGLYAFTPSYLMIMSYDSGVAYCSDTPNGLPGNLCPWVCQQFGGTWQSFFLPNNTAPTSVSFNPITSGSNWGQLSVAIPLACNTSSCGAPPVFSSGSLPENATFNTVNANQGNFQTVNTNVRKQQPQYDDSESVLEDNLSQ